MSHKYPSRAEILKFAGQMASGNYADFFSHVSEHVDWTIMGTSPMSMRYTSLKHFQEATLGRLATILKEPGLKIMVHNVIGGEEQEWATIELKANAECKNGLPYQMSYAWILRFDENGMIVQVRAYLDTALLKQALEENECPSMRAPIEF